MDLLECDRKHITSGDVQCAATTVEIYTMKTAPEFSAYEARLTEESRVESIRAAEMGA